MGRVKRNPGDAMDLVLASMGGGLYTTRQLASMAGLTVNTVYKSVHCMIKEGLLLKQRGTRVAGSRGPVPYVYGIKG